MKKSGSIFCTVVCFLAAVFLLSACTSVSGDDPKSSDPVDGAAFTQGLGTELPEPDDSLEPSDERDEETFIQRHISALAEPGTEAYELVAAKFGADAWDNVTYTIEEREPLDGTLAYRDKATGELISQTEYERALSEYWNEVAALEGVRYEDLVLTEGESAAELNKKRVDLLAKYSEGIPVELVTVSDSKTYNVYLAFHGKTTSEDGFSSFRFVIDNRSGEWEVFQDLTWHEPYPQIPEGD